MKLTSPFILLLGSRFSLSLGANAVLLISGKKSVVTLPLKRVPRWKHLHAQLVRISCLCLLRLLHIPHDRSSNNTLNARTNTYDGSPGAFYRSTFDIFVSRHAHLVGRSSPRVGLANVELKEQGSKNNSAIAAWVLLLLFRSLFDSLLVSSGKRATVRDAAELDTSTGFSPVDMNTLDPAFVTTGDTSTVADTLGFDIVANDRGIS